MKLPEKLPTSLARSSEASNLFTRTGAAYNYAIAGQPFMSAASTERPIIRETAPIRKEQFDNQRLPGEQTLEYWWLRSQQSFHGGAGQVFADPTEDNPFNDIRFRTSRNVNPWVQGELQLLNEAAASGVPVAGVRDATEFNYGDGDPAVFAVTDTDIVVVRATTVDTATFGESTETLQSVTTDGSFIIVAALDGVWLAPIPASYSSAIGTEFVFTKRFDLPNNTDSVFMAWVKSRTILTVGRRLYEVGSITSGDGLIVTGTSGDFASTPDASSLDITGDIDLRAVVTADDWNTSEVRYIISKYNSSTDQRSYALSLQNQGVRLNWSTDGSSFNGITSTAFDAPETGSLAVRATLDVDDGASNYVLTFYTSDSLTGTWTQLEQITNPGPTSIFSSPTDLTCSGISDGTIGLFSGTIHAAEVRDGIGGTVVANPDFSAQTIGTEQFQDSAGNTWTVQGNAEISSSTNLPTPRFTHTDPDWEFTGITETSPAIYAVGNSNDVRGSILKFVLDQDGEVPTLSAATVAATLPSGEVPYSALGYLGQFIGIGTNKGVRVGVSDETGDIEYGPLLFEVTEPVRAWSARDRFLWCTVSQGNEGDSGLYRIDLSLELAPLRFPYATDLVANDDVSDCNAVAHIGSSDKLFFATANDVYTEQDDKALVGTLQTSRIRYNTLEPKLYKFVRVRGPILEAPLALIVLDQSDSIAGTHLFPLAQEPGQNEITLFSPASPIDFASLRFQFTRDGTDTTIGPTIWAYQLKALPASPRQRVIELPLWCFDWEVDRSGQRRGGNGTAQRRIMALEDAERSGNTVILQDFDVRENSEVAIERIRFEQTAPPPRFEGWGGVITATLRTVR